MILSHYHDHRDHYKVLYYLFYPLFNNKENKDEEFLSFLHLSIGLFLSVVSV